MSVIRVFFAILLLSIGPLFARAQAPDVVTLNGTQWLQPANFAHYSWSEVAAVCDVAAAGHCSGHLGDVVLDGWTWASASEIAGLFNLFIGTGEFPGEAAHVPRKFLDRESTWATDFFNAGFRPQHTVNSDRYLTAYLRNEVEAPGLPASRLWAGISAYSRPYCDSVCNVAEVNEGWDYIRMGAPPAYGYWFYRSAEFTRE